MTGRIETLLVILFSVSVMHFFPKSIFKTQDFFLNVQYIIHPFTGQEPPLRPARVMKFGAYKVEEDTVPTLQDCRPVNLYVKHKEISAVIGMQRIHGRKES